MKTKQETQCKWDLVMGEKIRQAIAQAKGSVEQSETTEGK